MDGYSGKRAVDGLVMSRKRADVILRDSMNNKDTGVPICSRIGCSARINPVKGSRIGSLDKAKSTRPSFRPSSSGKEIAGSSSGTCSLTRNARKPLAVTDKQLSSQLETDSSETSSVYDEPEALQQCPPPGKSNRAHSLGSEGRGPREVKTVEAGNSGFGTNTRARRSKRSEMSNQDGLTGSSGSLPVKTNQVARANVSRQGLSSLKCNSISDVVPSGCSSSVSSGTKVMAKTRKLDRENSSSNKGKKISQPQVEGRNQNSSRSVSISDTRRPKVSPNNRDNGVASVGTWRSINGYCRTRNSNQRNRNNSSPVATPEVPYPEMPTDLDASVSSELATSPRSSYSRPGSSGGLLRNMPGSPSELGFSRSLLNRDNFRRYNIDGIAEVLLALERIEQDEELTYEQLLVLETNLFLNGLNFYDQHREMRLDIDNMSYEELLALEERMGTVSTALTEESLSKCIKTSIYQPTAPQENISGSCAKKDDVKCSICQEEYVEADEVGRLLCEHKYHAACIQGWLRMKNWCPICKAPAEPSTAISLHSSPK